MLSFKKDIPAEARPRCRNLRRSALIDHRQVLWEVTAAGLMRLAGWSGLDEGVRPLL